MLAYAANSPNPAGRAGSPKALALILAGHAALIGAVLTVKMDLIPIETLGPTEIVNIPVEPPPPPPQEVAKAEPKKQIPQPRFIDDPRKIVDMNQATSIQLDSGTAIQDIGIVIGSGPTTIVDPPKAEPVRLAARFATPNSAIKPPYPLDKRRAEEEATLRLRISIDEHGRVTSVEPIGPADASFLEAARRHILRAWRYKPATEDGQAVPSSTVINLSFRLEDV
jgi:protein TonB